MSHPSKISRKRATSDPNDDILLKIEERKKQSAFPKLHDFSGYLDIKTRSTKSWKRKYFVLANNFLLMSSTPYSKKLEKVIPLEGSNVKTSTKTSALSFEILIRKKRNQFRAPNELECNQWTEKIQRASKLKIKDIYRFDAILGTNATGTTKVLSAKHRVTGDDVAVKIISKKEYNPKMLSNEVLILKRLDHPHVVKLFDLFETRKAVYLVMEKCNGGELFEQIANLPGGGGFSEKACITVIHQIAKAVKYMHSMGIVHRDLKPENILCVVPDSIEFIKIADFGISKVIFDPDVRRKEKEQLRKAKKQQIQKQKQIRTLAKRAQELYESHWNEEDDCKYEQKSQSLSPRTNQRRKKSKKKKFIDPLARKKQPNSKRRRAKNKRLSNAFNDVMSTMCGTISYTAPEILKERPYDKRVDYWSLGVIMFILLCGYPPFWGDTELDVAKSILGPKVVLDSDDWSHVSDAGKRLVLGLLERNPNKRLGIDSILKHTWIYASKAVNKKARKSFMKTVAKRRIRKMSMGVFEKSSKKMDYLYRNHMDRKQSRDNEVESSISSLEKQSSDSVSVSASRDSLFDSYTNRNSISMSDFRRYSRTDDDLFELRLPSMSYTPRASMADMVDNGILDEEFTLGNGHSHSRRTSRSVKRKYSQ